MLVLDGARMVTENRKAREVKAERAPDHVTSAFARKVPEEGAAAASFASLGEEGWDIQGLLRDVNILNGKENRGDCCSVRTPFSVTVFGVLTLWVTGRLHILLEHDVVISHATRSQVEWGYVIKCR